MEKNLHDPITFKNIDSKPFEVKHNSKVYWNLKPGEVKVFPRFLATLGLKHLIDRVLTKKDIRINNIVERQKLAKLIILKEDRIVQTPELTPEEKVKKQIKEYNSDLDLLEADAEKSKASLDIQAPPAPKTPPEDPKDIDSVLDKNKKRLAKEDDKPAEDEFEDADDPEPEGSEEVEAPTRQQLYKWAEKNMGVSMDDKKTMAQWENMSLPELIKEFNYEK